MELSKTTRTSLTLAITIILMIILTGCPHEKPTAVKGYAAGPQTITAMGTIPGKYLKQLDSVKEHPVSEIRTYAYHRYDFNVIATGSQSTNKAKAYFEIVIKTKTDEYDCQIVKAGGAGAIRKDVKTCWIWANDEGKFDIDIEVNKKGYTGWDSWISGDIEETYEEYEEPGSGKPTSTYIKDGEKSDDDKKEDKLVIKIYEYDLDGKTGYLHYIIREVPIIE